MIKATEWVKSHKPHVAALVVAVIAAICLVVAAACGAFSPSAPQTEQEEPSTAQLTIGVTADSGWDEESTPAIAHVVGEDVDFYHAINPDAEGNKGASTVELAEGDYTVSLISPLNRDGSAYKMYGTSEEQQVALEAGGELSVDFVMTLIAPEDVTDGMVQSIVSQTRLAVNNGDETLKGDVGRSVLDRLAQNATANPNTSDETKDEAAKAEEETDVDGEPTASIPSASDSSQGGAGAADSGGGSSGGGVSSGGGSDGGKASSHTHSWKDHTATRQVWVSNMVTVPDYETQTIYGAQFYTMTASGQYVSNGPTYWFENGFTRDDLKAIIAEGLRNADENGLYNGVYYGNYVNRTKTEQVQVGSHQEDQGWYETESYVDYQYCDCGATK